MIFEDKKLLVKYDYGNVYDSVIIHCLKKSYHPTTNDNFNSDCLILIIFGTNINE